MLKTFFLFYTLLNMSGKFVVHEHMFTIKKKLGQNILWCPLWGHLYLDSDLNALVQMCKICTHIVRFSQIAITFEPLNRFATQIFHSGQVTHRECAKETISQKFVDHRTAD